MSLTVRIPPVIDLVGLVGNYGKSVKGISFAVVLLDTVAAPSFVVNKAAYGDYEWKTAGILWATINKPTLRDNCRNHTVSSYIENLEEFMSTWGMVIVAVPRGTTGYKQIRGTLSFDKRSGASLIMNKWVKTETDFKVSACDVADIDTRFIPDGLKAVYASVQANTMNDLLKKNVFNISGLQCALIGRTSVGNMPVLTGATAVEVDKQGIILNRVAEQTANSVIPSIGVDRNQTLGISAAGSFDRDSGVAVAPQAIAVMERESEYEVFEPTQNVESSHIVPDERGEYIKNGRTFYNREDFRYNISFQQTLSDLLSSANQRITVLERMLNTCETISLDNIRRSLASKLLAHFTTKVSPNVGYTGYILTKLALNTLKEYIDSMILTEEKVDMYNSRADACGDANICIADGMCKDSRRNLVRVYKETLKNKDSIRQCLVCWERGLLSSDTLANTLIVYSDLFILAIISKLLKLKIDILAFTDCSDPLSIIFTNPYYLIFAIDRSIDILDLDKLAMLAGKFGSADCTEVRCIAYYHQLMCSDKNSFVNCRTMIPLYEVKRRMPYGFFVTKAYNTQLLYNKPFAVDATTLANCSFFLEGITNRNNFLLPVSEFKEFNNMVIYTWNGVNSDTAINTYIQSGFGVKLNKSGTDYLADYNVLSKEYNIFEMCRTIYETKHFYVDKEKVEEALTEFEQLKRKELNDASFKFEEKQAEFIRRTGSNIMALSGGAGTGKTTTMEAVIYIFEHKFNIPSNRIMLIAPTGKASVRLRYLTKRKTSTIASALLRNRDSLDADVIIIDESSMISLDTMHSLLSAISPETFVVFAGDIAQLLPIGMGKPFALMLKYLPCVTLEVSKRALGTSNITKNANKLLDLGDNTGFEQGADFRFVPCSTNDVLPVIQTIVREELIANNNIADNIQIVSPMKKEALVWGTNQLNTSLRDLFNPDTRNQSIRSLHYYKGTKECCLHIGDRVVHLQNHAKANRFDVSVSERGYSLSLLETTGVMNGDIGILKYIVKANEIQYMDIFDLDITNGDMCYALVEYEDVDPETGDIIKYFIKYDCELLQMCTPSTPNEIWVNEGVLEELELAFALTVHKMQGSQSNVVIFPIFSLGYMSDFMSNNLVYTAWTRAIKKVIVVGSIETVMQAKRTLIINRRTSIFDHY